MRTYEDVAAALSVRICFEDADEAHLRGFVGGNTVHWTPRRMTRRGLRNFLMLVAEIRVLRFAERNRAMRIYAANAWATKAAAGLHIRLPRSYAHADRVYMRWLVANGDAVSPAAHRWAYRKD